jgi:DNA-directed RNA polymerase sigma subunit (sigma70/sigma32)
MEMIYGVNQKNQYTVKEIAEHLNMTSESIRQIRIRTLRKLTNWVRSGKIQEY